MASEAFIQVVADTDGVEGQMRRDMTRAINAVERTLPDIDVDVDVDTTRMNRSLRSSSAGLTSLTGQFQLLTSRIALMGSAALTALPAVTASIGGVVAGAQRLVASFGGVNGVFNQLLGIGAVAGGAFAVLRISLVGVGDAFQALTGPADKFNKALERLSPEAQRVFTTMRSGVPAINEFKNALQDALFRGISTSTVDGLVGSLRSLQPAGEAVAAAFGGVAESFGEFLAQESTLNQINTILRAAVPIVSTLGNLVVNVLAKGLDRAAQGTELFGSSFDTLTGIFESVKAVLADVVGIFGALGQAAQTAGVALGGPLANALHAVSEVLNSAIGQQFLVTLNQLVSTIFSAVVPVLQALLRAVVPVAQALGVALQPVIEALSPVLQHLANTLGQVLLALVPLLTPLIQLIVAILPVLNPLITALGALLVSLAPVVVALANALTVLLVPILNQIPPLLNALLIPLTQVVTQQMPLFRQVIQQLTPVLAQLAAAIANNIQQMIPLVSAVLAVAAQFTRLAVVSLPLINVVIRLTSLIVSLAGVQLRILAPALRFVTALIQGNVSGAFRGLANTISRTFSAIVSAASRFVGSVRSAVTPIIGILRSIGTSAFNAMRSAVSAGINAVVNLVRSLPSRVRSALGNLGSLLFSSGASLMSGFIRGIASKIGDLVSTVKGAVGKARRLFPFSPAKEGPFSGKGYTTYSGAALIDGFIQGIDKQVPALRASLSQALGTAQISAQPATAGVPSSATPAQAAARELTVATGGAGSPIVTVMIGNQVINDHIDVRIDRNNQTRDRLGAQGVRR